jgi:hypothetical protein
MSRAIILLQFQYCTYLICVVIYVLLLSYDYFDETLRRNVPKCHCGNIYILIYSFLFIYMYVKIHMYSGGVVLLVISWLGVTALQTKPIACQPTL